ncbi:LysR family transcriptional regulator [Cellvibrio sp. PSBB006]|uniref:LysR family transcriptional regulator n=1 Tax=Cellvibrio sp. PSBB006 TaxID=1987723 RepID=UPI000B3B43A3|nr:LysR family transcriptional regulator [Cellvibrio sp. PSBB006]ARU26565.1 transcriptional regulator [Cellvibrio sp. PSBB006]
MSSSKRVRAILSFIQAADAGSFAAAARVLGISSAAVSKNVASLEQSLGVRLMNRTTRTLSLTDEGAAFLEQARIALAALDTAVEAVASRQQAPSGRIRIASSVAFGREQIMPILPGLLARYPELSVEVDFDDRMIDFVQEGYDIAVRGGVITDSALISRPICRLNMVLVATPAYLSQRGIPRTPQDLVRHKLIARKFLGGRLSPWNFHTADGGSTSIDPCAAVLTLSEPESLVRAALAGIGIAQVGVHHAWAHLVSGDLNVLLPGIHNPGSYELVMQYPHRALIAPRVRVTLDYLLNAFAEDKRLHIPLSDLNTFSV